MDTKAKKHMEQKEQRNNNVRMKRKGHIEQTGHKEQRGHTESMETKAKKIHGTKQRDHKVQTQTQGNQITN